MIGIYKITNTINNMCYIGQSKNIHKRWNNHKSVYNNENAHEYDYYLYRAMRKYGIENFTFDVIEECDINSLNDREIYWINYYDSYNNGYNSTNGGDNGKSYVKISSDDLLKITNLLQNSDIKIQSIADEFNVSYEMIQGINTGRHWIRDIEYPIRKHKNKIINVCIDCGKIIDNKAERCWDCYVKSCNHNKKPTKNELLQLLLTNSMEAIGRLFDVSGKAIRKWCDQYGIPHLKKDVKQYIIDNDIN